MTVSSTINQRVAQLIKMLEMNKNSFSVAIGVDSSIIHNIVDGRKTKPSFDVLQKIVLSNDNINSDWLITGRGLPFLVEGSAKGSLKGSLSVVQEANSQYKKDDCAEAKKENVQLKAQIDVLLAAFKAMGLNPPK